MIYEFKCSTCGTIDEHSFLWSELEKILHEEKDTWGYIEYYCCRCDSITQQYRGISKAPAIQGGDHQYMSMEKYWELHPEAAKRKRDEIVEIKQKRRRKIEQRINKQKTNPARRSQRHKDYGSGGGEERLKLDG